MTNEKQKETTEQYRNNYDSIFNKPNPLADKMVKQIEDHLKEQEYHTPED